jgi:crotonobetainyl-CoA:carnitine CoA-transferase CaiB-like acyl-CoA transferase
VTRSLDGVFVLDISEGVAGAYCTKLLADLGADVLKIEAPAGDPVRRLGPFPDDRPDQETGGLHLHLNAGKRSAVLDLENASDREPLFSLLGRADVLIESLSPGRAASLGLEHDELVARNPRLVAVSVTPFGRSGPYSGWKTDEVVDWAMGGYMYFGGEPERHPLLVPGHQGALHAGTHAAIGALAGLTYARRTGLGQSVEVSHFESLLLAHAWLSTSWTHEGQVMKRTPSTLVRCADGDYVYFFAAIHSDNFFLLIERLDLAEKEEYATPQRRMARAQELLPFLREWCAGLPAPEVERRAQELRIACTRVVDAAGLASSPQMAARGWFQTIEQPGLGPVRLPGAPYRLSRTPARARGPAPRLGEHTAEVLGAPVAPILAGAAGGANGGNGDLPLEGVRIVEVTANWAGPLSARHLADLGADVIKVEWATRPATRAGRFPGGVRGKRFYNRAGYFNKLNRNKRDVCLDLSKPEGREVFLRLADWADVLIENNSARVMPNLGLGYEDLARRNPRLIMLSMSGFGATGPLRDYLAYGSNIELSCGLASLTGYGPGQPSGTGSFYADPVSGNHGAVAVLAALEHRRRTGEGQFIDLALNECAAAMFGEALTDHALNGRVRGPMGARSLRYAPQGVYRCFGEDAWLALVVRDEAEWRALCAVVGRDDLASRPDLASVVGRMAAHDEIDEAIAAWSADEDHWDAARALQAAGVPAGPVLANWEVVSDPHLHQRSFFIYVNHPEAGVLPYPGFAWRLSRTPARLRRPAPLFGQHNREVFQDLVGLGEAEVEDLYAAGVTADVPEVYADPVASL